MTNVQKHVTLQGLVGPVFKPEQTQNGSLLCFVLYCQNTGGVKHTQVQICRMQALGRAADFLSEYLKSGQRIALDAMPVTQVESGAGPLTDADYLVVDFLLLNSG